MARPLNWKIEEYLNDRIRFYLYIYSDRSGGPKACWPWKGKRNPEGRGTISMPTPLTTKGRKTLAYRSMWELYRWRLLEPGEQVNHWCDNPTCVNPFHLYQGSQKANIEDKLKRIGYERRMRYGATV